MKVCLGMILLLILLAIPPASLLAEPLTPEGFGLRLQIGTGLGAFKDTPKDDTFRDLEYRGLSGYVRAQILFGFKKDNVSLDLGFNSIADNDPTIKRNGESDSDFTGSYGLAAFSFGISYYMASGFYISPELRYIFNATDNFGNATTTFTGLGAGFSIGKEWELSSRWNMGLALMYISDELEGDETSPPKQSYEGEASHRYFGLALSASWQLTHRRDNHSPP